MTAGLDEQNKLAGEDQIERVGNVVEHLGAMADAADRAQRRVYGKRKGRPMVRTAPALEDRFG
jgi:hypothetical protein